MNNLMKSVVAGVSFFLLGVFLSSFMSLGFGASVFGAVLPALLGTILLVLCFLIKYDKFKYILVYVSLFLLGISYYTFSVLHSGSSQKLCLGNYLNEEIVLGGYISSNPCVFENRVLISIEPKFVRKTSNNKKSFLKEKAYVIIDAPVRFLDKIPGFREFYEFDGVIRQLSSSERQNLYRLGVRINSEFTMDGLSNVGKIENPREGWIRLGVRDLAEKIFGLVFSDIKTEDLKFLRFVFLGDMNGLRPIFRTEYNSLSGIMPFVYSHFYIWFILVLTLVIGGSLGVKRRFVYIFSIPLVIFFIVLNSFNFEVMAPCLFMIAFLLFASHYHIGKSILYAIVSSGFVLVLFDPFIFTDKWFLYFILLTYASACLIRGLDRFLCDVTKGWILWGLFCVLLTSASLAIFDSYQLLRFFLICAGIFLALMVFFQKIYPWQDLEYSKINKFFRLLISWVLTVYVLVLIPFSLFYVDPVDISGILLCIPLLFVFIILVQFGFIGMIAGLGIFMSIPKFFDKYIMWYQVFIGYLVDFFSFLSEFFVRYFPGRFILPTQNGNSALIFYMLIFVGVYVIYINQDYVLRYLEEAAGFLRKVRRTYLIFASCVIFFVLLFSISLDRNMAFRLIQNDYGRYLSMKSPKGERIVIADIYHEDFESLTLELNRRWGNIDFFLKNGAQDVDIWVITGEYRNTKAFRMLGDVFKYIKAKKLYMDLDKACVDALGKYKEYLEHYFMEIPEEELWYDYMNMQSFFHKNLELVGPQDEAHRDLFGGKKIIHYDKFRPEGRIYHEEGKHLFYIDILEIDGSNIIKITYDVTNIYVISEDIDIRQIKREDILQRKVFYVEGESSFRLVIDTPIFDKGLAGKHFFKISKMLEIEITSKEVEVK